MTTALGLLTYLRTSSSRTKASLKQEEGQVFGSRRQAARRRSRAQVVGGRAHTCPARPRRRGASSGWPRWSRERAPLRAHARGSGDVGAAPCRRRSGATLDSCGDAASWAVGPNRPIEPSLISKRRQRTLGRRRRTRCARPGCAGRGGSLCAQASIASLPVTAGDENWQGSCRSVGRGNGRGR